MEPVVSLDLSTRDVVTETDFISEFRIIQRSQLNKSEAFEIVFFVEPILCKGLNLSVLNLIQ
jgi:hypothetical protein